MMALPRPRRRISVSSALNSALRPSGPGVTSASCSASVSVSPVMAVMVPKSPRSSASRPRTSLRFVSRNRPINPEGASTMAVSVKSKMHFSFAVGGDGRVEDFLARRIAQGDDVAGAAVLFGHHRGFQRDGAVVQGDEHLLVAMDQDGCFELRREDRTGGRHIGAE